MMIRAIETAYKGYRFRSRLEARWAVFFDTMGWEYEYEPEGFLLESGMYLPDFFVLSLDMWVEVKPRDRGPSFTFEMDKAYRSMTDLTDHTMRYGLVISGDPFVSRYSMRCFGGWAAGMSGNPVFAECRKCDSGVWIVDEDNMIGYGIGCICGDYKYATDGERIMAAYRRSSGARFEHGESP